MPSMSDWIALWLAPLEFWASYWRAVFAYRERPRLTLIEGGKK